MFQSNLLEYFTHIAWFTPLILYVPVAFWMLYLATARDIPPPLIAALVLGGLLIWTLVEYTMHRFVFHYEPRSAWGKKLHFMMHGVHHDYPSDATRLVMPPLVSVPLAVLFYGLFCLLFGRAAPAVFAGLLIGYLFYDMLHYATHHLPMKKGVWLFLKRYHLRHHFQDDHAGYGVSSPLWDHVFRTRRRHAQTKQLQTFQEHAVGATLPEYHGQEN